MDLCILDNKDIIELYDKYVDLVYRICFMHLKKKEDAEDATSSTFIKLMENISKLKDDEHVKAWLIVTSSNICKNSLKYWWRRNISIDMIKEQAVNVPLLNETLSAITELPNKYKTIIYLYYYEGYKNKEIAKILKMNESTVRYDLSIARKLLKDKLGGE